MWRSIGTFIVHLNISAAAQFTLTLDRNATSPTC